MIWPSGFVMRHKKQTVEYRSDESLHNKNYPYLSVKIQGGVIIDLQTSEIAPQISQLVDTNELLADGDLSRLLHEKLSVMKNKAGRQIDTGQNMVGDILDSELMKTLPIDSQYSIRKFLQQRSCGLNDGGRDFKFKKRDIKLGSKMREVTSLI